jgi:hypothetical protein
MPNQTDHQIDHWRQWPAWLKFSAIATGIIVAFGGALLIFSYIAS